MLSPVTDCTRRSPSRVPQLGGIESNDVTFLNRIAWLQGLVAISLGLLALQFAPFREGLYSGILLLIIGIMSIVATRQHGRVLIGFSAFIIAGIAAYASTVADTFWFATQRDLMIFSAGTGVGALGLIWSDTRNGEPAALLQDMSGTLAAVGLAGWGMMFAIYGAELATSAIGLVYLEVIVALHFLADRAWRNGHSLIALGVVVIVLLSVFPMDASGMPSDSGGYLAFIPLQDIGTYLAIGTGWTVFCSLTRANGRVTFVSTLFILVMLTLGREMTYWLDGF